MGIHRSFFDFYMGFGSLLWVAQLMLAVILWQLGSLARTHLRALRSIIAVIALATVAGGVIAWHFISPIPALFCLVLLATLSLAYAAAR